jgi:NDP-sugar pyrophosphorylase family protein
MNILFPIAGAGSRFQSHGFNIPKPLVLVNGKTLLEHSITTLNLPGRYIFVRINYSNIKFNQQIDAIIKRIHPNAEIIILNHPTKGAAETCLKAESIIDIDKPLVVTNGDQWLNWRPQHFLDFVNSTGVDGCVSLYDHEDIEIGKPSKYAFVSLDQDGYATNFCEKFAISNNALNGIHYWRSGKDFIYSIKKMIANNIKVNNEFYISPSYNYLIKDGKLINTYPMKLTEYRSLGSPEEIEKNLDWL